MNPLIVCFYDWLINDVNWNYELTQDNLAKYVTDNYEYLIHNGFIEVMTLPEFVEAINIEDQYPEVICLFNEEIYAKLVKTITS